MKIQFFLGYGFSLSNQNFLKDIFVERIETKNLNCKLFPAKTGAANRVARINFN